MTAPQPRVSLLDAARRAAARQVAARSSALSGTPGKVIGIYLGLAEDGVRVKVSIDGSEPIVLSADPGRYVKGGRVWVAVDAKRRPTHVLGPAEDAPAPGSPGHGLGEVVLPNTIEDFTARESVAAAKRQLDEAAQWIAETGAELDRRLEEAEGDLGAAGEALTRLRDVDLPAAQREIDEAAQWIAETGAELGRRLSELEDADLASGYTFSEAAPKTADGADKAANHVWIRVNAEGDQTGFWHWDGAAWVEHGLDPAFLPVVAIGTGTAGDLTVDRLAVGAAQMKQAVIDELWTRVVRSRKITADMVLVGAGDNLVVNGNFEDGLEGWALAGTPPTVANAIVYSGTKAVAFPGGSTGIVAAAGSAFDIQPGDVLRFRAWVRNNSGNASVGTGGFRLVADATGSDVTTGTWSGDRDFSRLGTSGADTDKWFLRTAYFTSTGSARVRPRMAFASLGAAIYVDNYEIHRVTDSSLIVDGAVTAKKITLAGDPANPDEVSLAANLAKILELSVEKLVVTAGATMKSATILELWNQVVRSRMITTDMLVVGSGANQLVDPWFENDTVKGYRNSRADIANATWGRNASLNLNWYGAAGQPTDRTKNFYFIATSGIADAPAFVQVRAGQVYRIQAKVNSTGGGVRFTARYIKTDGSTGYAALNGYDSASGVRDLDYEWTVPADWAYMQLAVQAISSATAFYIYGGASLTRATDSSLIVDGGIAARHLNIISSDPTTGYALSMQPDGLRLWAGPADDGEPSISLTTADAQSFSILDLQDRKVAGMDQAGNVIGMLGAFQAIELAGEDLGTLIGGGPGGAVSKVYLTGTSQTLSSTLTKLLSTDVIVPRSGPRQLRITIGILDDSANVQPVALEVKFNFSTTASLSNTTRREFHFDTQANRVQHTFVWELNTDELGWDGTKTGDDRFLSVLVAARTAAGASGVAVLGNSFAGGETFMTVEDLGSAIPTSRQAADASGGGVSGKATRVREFVATGFTVFRSSGSAVTTGGNPIQGYSPYAASMGVKGSHLYFDDAAIRSLLSGATVDKVEVYLFAEHWYSSAGGTAGLWTHAYSGAQSSMGSMSYIGAAGFARGQGRWLGLPTDGWASGSRRGVGVYPPGGSTASAYYGYYAPHTDPNPAKRPRLRITYTK